MNVQILPVRHFVPIDGKLRDVNGVGLILVVPPKRLAAAFETERDDASRDLDAAVVPKRSDDAERFFFPNVGPNFAVERQLVQHVGERFRVHQAVLNGHVEQSGERKSVARREVGIEKRVG